MPSTTLQLNLYATITPVASPGGGSAKIGTTVLETFEAEGNSPVENQTVTASAATTTWDFDGANPISSVIAGESTSWYPKGFLVKIGAVDTAGTLTGLCQIKITDDTAADIDVELGYGGLFVFKPFAADSASILVDSALHIIAITWDATAQAATNLTAEIFVIC